jgi:phasin family protein
MAKEMNMSTTGANIALETCKRQLECAITVIEAITEGAKTMRKAQLEAATKAGERAVALHGRIAGAADAQELWRAQSEWARESFEAALAHWRELADIALATQSLVAKCASGQQLPSAARRTPGAAEPSQVVEMMDAAYKRWLESTRQFYAPPVVSEPQIRQPA